MITFRKRTLRSPGQFFRLLFSAAGRMMGMRRFRADVRISPQMAERVMLAVTGVNECLYCTWRHTHDALAKGLDPREIQSLLRGEVEGASEHEAVALAFAQHFAESEGRPSAEARRRLVDHYGEPVARQVEAFASVCSFGNLCSNIVEAGRLGAHSQDGRSCAWLILLLARPVAWFVRRGVEPAGSTSGESGPEA